MTRRRVAVTGLGVVSTCGVGTDAFWDGLCGPAPEGDRLVPDFDPFFVVRKPKKTPGERPLTQFALAAADMALEQAGKLTGPPTRRGVFIGTGIGGIQTLEDQILVMSEKGPRRVSPFLIPMMMPNAAPGPPYRCGTVSQRALPRTPAPPVPQVPTPWPTPHGSSPQTL
ncbi:MAG: hypothetical protein Ct9H300mP12_05090 [Acidimicrobiales bacterium]|nr:MAG: hypothetical protein Ct9H300mP12_05090 [Acidimicrobiales bacterium]